MKILTALNGKKAEMFKERKVLHYHTQTVVVGPCIVSRLAPSDG